MVDKRIRADEGDIGAGGEGGLWAGSTGQPPAGWNRQFLTRVQLVTSTPLPCVTIIPSTCSTSREDITTLVVQIRRFKMMIPMNDELNFIFTQGYHELLLPLAIEIANMI